MEKEITYEEALLRMESLCVAAEHCSHDVRAKMEKLGISAPSIDKAIAHLTAERYIDEGRFAQAFTRDKLRFNHWGPYKIAQSLRMLGIRDEDIRQGLECVAEEEYAGVLRLVMEQKNRQLRDEDPYVRRCKLVRHAASRGFGTDAAMREAERITEST